VIGTVQQRVLFQDALRLPGQPREGALDRAHAALQVPSHRRRKGDRQGCGVQAILLRRALLGESFQTPRHRTQREAVCRRSDPSLKRHARRKLPQHFGIEPVILATLHQRRGEVPHARGLATMTSICASRCNA